MRVYVLLLLLMLATPIVSAVNDSSLSDIFSGNGTDILPPAVSDDVPEGIPAPAEQEEQAAGALKSADTLMLAEAAAVTGAWTGGPKDLVLDIVDAETGEPIKNAHIRVFMDNGEEKIGTLRFVGDDGKMGLQLENGQWGITLMLDITETVGKDYYAEIDVSISADLNMTLFLQPVGSLGGEVVDENNNLLPNALIKFDCAGDYGVLDSVNTDGFGAFKAEWLPVGQCKVSALVGSRTGSATVQIVKGQLSEVRIQLEQNIAPVQQADYSMLIITVIVIIALAVFALHFFRMKKPQVSDQKASPIMPDKRMGDILSALDANERSIIKSLLSSGGRSQQNKLARELGLPKSSLSRAISGLETRDLVRTERFGRIRKVELSSWFLNGKKTY